MAALRYTFRTGRRWPISVRPGTVRGPCRVSRGRDAPGPREAHITMRPGRTRSHQDCGDGSPRVAALATGRSDGPDCPGCSPARLSCRCRSGRCSVIFHHPDAGSPAGCRPAAIHTRQQRDDDAYPGVAGRTVPPVVNLGQPGGRTGRPSCLRTSGGMSALWCSGDSCPRLSSREVEFRRCVDVAVGVEDLHPGRLPDVARVKEVDLDGLTRTRLLVDLGEIESSHRIGCWRTTPCGRHRRSWGCRRRRPRSTTCSRRPARRSATD